MSINIRTIRVYVYRAPIDTPVITSFGVMIDRPAVIVRLEDDDGGVGWGEVWCNFPSCGAEHRAKLIETVLAPLLFNTTFEHPADAYDSLSKQTHILGIQTGEIGPIAQSIAGVDIALWDLFARKNNMPLFQLLGGANPEIPVYASGINPNTAAETISRAREEGFKAFKIKIGFGHKDDLKTVTNAIATLVVSEKLMADANQAWNVDEAIEFIQLLDGIPLAWLEEPIPADRPDDEWYKVAAASDVPIAAGENIRGASDFSLKVESGVLGIVQPDICKWGGISANLLVAREIIASQARYCPHYLGGGIGLIASAHLLSAAGGDGLLEVDVNTNPLREGLAAPFPKISDGKISLSSDPGLGIVPVISDLEKICVYRVHLSNP